MKKLLLALLFLHNSLIKSMDSDVKGLTVEQIEQIINLLPLGLITQEEILNTSQKENNFILDYSLNEINNFSQQEKEKLNHILNGMQQEKRQYIFLGQELGQQLESIENRGLFQEVVEEQSSDECGMKTLENMRNVIANFLGTYSTITRSEQLSETCRKSGKSLLAQDIKDEWNTRYGKIKQGDELVPLIVINRDYIIQDIEDDQLDLYLMLNKNEKLENVAATVVHNLKEQKICKSACAVAINTASGDQYYSHWFGLVFLKNRNNLKAVITESLGLNGNIDRRVDETVVNLFKKVQEAWKYSPQELNMRFSLPLLRCTPNSNQFRIGINSRRSQQRNITEGEAGPAILAVESDDDID